MINKQMPRGIHIAILSVCLTLLAAVSAQAQLENCSECDQGDMTPWSQGNYRLLACDGECVYQISYRFRECANGRREMIMDDLIPLNPGTCAGLDLGDLVHSSVIPALLDVTWVEFNVVNPQFGYEVCVIMPTCLEHDPVTDDIFSCSSSCCKTCYDLSLVTQINMVLVMNTFQTTSIGTANCVGACENICSEMQLPYPTGTDPNCDFGCIQCNPFDATPFVQQNVTGCYGDCNLSVNFEWRICEAFGTLELALRDFCVTNYPCSITDENTLVQAAMELVLQQAHTVFNVPDPYNQPYRIWYSQPSCLAFDQTTRCFTNCLESCCAQSYDLQLDANGQVVVLEMVYNHFPFWGSQVCSGSVNGAPCVNRCEVLDIAPLTVLTANTDCPASSGPCSEDCYWTLEGNAGTDPSLNFLGTTDYTDLVLRTNNLERMRILSTGQVGINNSAPSFDADLHVGSNNYSRIFIGTNEYIEDGLSSIVFNPNPPSGIGDVSPAFDCVTDFGTGDMRWDNLYLCGQVWTTSDMHNKREIESLAYGLDQVMALNPVSYKLMDGHNTPRLGLLAQEVQSVIPEVVYDPAAHVKLDEAGNPIAGWHAAAHMGLAYQDLLPVLVKAVQQQSARLQALETGKVDDVQLGSHALDARVAAFSDILLEQNQPNPLTDETTVAYYVPAQLDGQVELLVQDLSGREVLPRFNLQTGVPATVQIDASQLPAGVYVYGIAVQGQMIVSKKLMLIRN